MLMLGCTLFPPIYKEIENWDLDFPIFPMMKEVKNWSFLDYAGKRSLVDQSMLFTHLYLMLGQKIEARFLSPARREYFGVASTAFLSASKFSKKIYPLVR